MALDLGSAYAVHDGHFVSEDHMRIAEIIQDYDPDLRLVWIPNDQRTEADKGREFAVVHKGRDGQDYVVFHLPAEEVDHRLLARLFQSDNHQGSVLNYLEAQDQARQIIEAKKQLEAQEEHQEFVKDVLKSPKSRYKHNGRVYQ